MKLLRDFKDISFRKLMLVIDALKLGTLKNVVLSLGSMESSSFAQSYLTWVSQCQDVLWK